MDQNEINLYISRFTADMNFDNKRQQYNFKTKINLYRQRDTFNLTYELFKLCIYKDKENVKLEDNVAKNSKKAGEAILAMVKEISKFKKENEELTEELNKDEISKLKKENEKLRQFLYKEFGFDDYDDDDAKKLKDEITRLKDEITGLKEEIDGDGFWGVNPGLKKEKLDLMERYKQAVKEISKLKQFINQHKVKVVKLDDKKKFIEGHFISTEYSTNRNDGFAETTETINLYIQKRTPQTLWVMRANGLNGTERYKILLDDHGNEYIKLFHNCNVSA